MFPRIRPDLYEAAAGGMRSRREAAPPPATASAGSRPQDDTDN
jgi:hypothetical protein